MKRLQRRRSLYLHPASTTDETALSSLPWINAVKIKQVVARIARLPANEPLTGVSMPSGATRAFVLATITTSDGVEGIGVTFFGGALTGALKVAVEELGALLVSEDPLHIEAINEKLRESAGSSGPAGIFTLAQAALDMALWDIKGKVLGLPLIALLGGSRDHVPVYASGALMRTFSIEEVERAAAKLV